MHRESLSGSSSNGHARRRAPTMKIPFAKIVRRAIACGCAGLALIACGSIRADEATLARFESTQPQMGVPFTIILYAPDEATANGAFQAAFARIAQLNTILSDYD